ncbi:MAG: hypothetical protein LBJ01_00495 [Tannerella sp.]|nr:hypothetical protein [Tannerella sp.]
MRTDSVSTVLERLTKAIPVPAARAELAVTLDGLLQLPVGAEFRERNGQAVVAVIRTEGGLTASATCDSLTLLVDELRTEIFHLNAEKGSFKSEESEIKTVEVNRLTGWQWFQVWTGRICLGLLMVFAVVKGLKRL